MNKFDQRIKVLRIEKENDNHFHIIYNFAITHFLRFMKVRSSIKKIDPDDQIVKRRGRLYVINKKKPRNKQRQG